MAEGLWFGRKLKDLCVSRATSYPIYLKDQEVAFSSRRVPRNATDKMVSAQFPMPPATIGLKDSREARLEHWNVKGHRVTKD